MSLTESRDTTPADASTNQTGAPPERPRRSLGQIVETMKNHRTMLLDPNFDPNVDIGSLIDGDVEDLMRKIDNTVVFNRQLEELAANARARAEQEIADAEAAETKIASNENYVMMQLAAAGRDEFNGHQFRYRRVHKGTSCVPLRPATAEDLVALGEVFVRIKPPVPARYEWQKDAIADAIESGTLPDGNGIARLDHSSKLKIESVDKPVDKKKRGKKP